jgi:hypothetical protein
VTRRAKIEASEHCACDAAGDVEEYEQLRGRVLAGDVSGRRMGLAVLQHRGVAAWLRVRRSVSQDPPPASGIRIAPVPGSVGDALVALLAGMALGAAARG